MKTKIRMNPAAGNRPSLRPRELPACCAILLFFAALFHSAPAPALGLRIPNQDAEAIARGNAFAATADNPAAIYYNPAGITQLDGFNAQFGAHIISINSTYESPNGASESHSKFEIQPVPELYVTYGLTNLPITFGLGMFAPYGLGIKWNDDVPFRTGGTEGRLTYLTINPVVAWKIVDQLSVAMGPTFNYSEVLLKQGVGIVPGDQFTFRGHGTDFGYTAGIRWQPLEKVAFGIKYHSGTTLKFDGTASTVNLGLNNTMANVSIPFAQFAAGGISYRPDTNWNFEVDLDWTDWGSLNSITFNNTPLGNVQKNFDWKTTWMYEVGATRYLANGYFVSAGYFYSPNTSSTQFYTPIIPDTDLHVGSLGFGHKGQKWAWTISGQVITGPSKVITDNVDPTVNGSYHWMNASVDFSIRYHL
jgi:long-chain fatty acid transport protein